MKKYYALVQIKENEKYDGCIILISESDNILSKLKVRNAVSINIFDTRKRAYDVLLSWRETWIENGTYKWIDSV